MLASVSGRPPLDREVGGPVAADIAHRGGVMHLKVGSKLLCLPRRCGQPNARSTLEFTHAVQTR
eukprot:10729908-Alexandrium_andersonii.AAC.1